jgi:hypothetical protein
MCPFSDVVVRCPHCGLRLDYLGVIRGIYEFDCPTHGIICLRPDSSMGPAAPADPDFRNN